jgi:hypothetical protein
LGLSACRSHINRLNSTSATITIFCFSSPAAGF